jgi:hypothetical protein
LNALRVHKTSLKSIIKNDEVIPKIQKIVNDVHFIKFHTCNILKIFCLHKFDETNKIPDINDKLVRAIMNEITISDGRGKKPSKESQKLKDEIKLVCEKHYKFVLKNKISRSQLSTLLDYVTNDIIGNFKTHITNFMEAIIGKVVNILLQKRRRELSIKMNHKFIYNKYIKDIRSFRSKLNKLKNAIYYGFEYNGKYGNYLYFIKNLLFRFNGKSICNETNKNPLSLIEGIINCSKTLERIHKKPINCFPLVMSTTPSYIPFDTTTIIRTLLKPYVDKSLTFYTDNMMTNRDFVWKKLFKTNKKVFSEKNYTFNNMILTDGIGCSILLINKNLYNPFKKNKVRAIKKPKTYKSTYYLTDLSKNQLKELQEMNLTGIDPGKNTLVYCTDGKKNNNKKYNKLEYTQVQRRKECQTKEYTNIIDLIKDNTQIKLLENVLSKSNHKSTNLNEFKKYVNTKNVIYEVFWITLKDLIFRKLKWWSKINKQRSEDQFINRFKNKFGNGKENAVLIGDWSEEKPMKNKEPTKGKSFRKLFRKNGFKVFLVDEFNTSKYHHKTKKELEKFQYNHDPRPFKHGTRLCHSLLRLKVVHNNELYYVNRDLNGALNILEKGQCIIFGKNIPNKLCRG